MKTGIVVEGGGMKCVYSSGILDRLLDDKITFDYGIGVSAGAANLITFIAGQRERTYRFYAKYSKRKEYMSFENMIKNKSYLNLEYIYGTLSNAGGEDPLCYEAFAANPMEFEAVWTDSRTGKPVYAGRDMVKKNDYKSLMATCAMPIFSRGIVIDGVRYYDGGSVDPLPVKRALEMGCDRLMIILAQPRDYVKPPQNMRLVYATHYRKNKELVKAIDNRHIVHRENKELAFKLEKEGRALIIAPSEKPKMRTLGVDVEQINELYNLALKDYGNTKEKWLEIVSK